MTIIWENVVLSLIPLVVFIILVVIVFRFFIQMKNKIDKVEYEIMELKRVMDEKDQVKQ